MSRPSGTVTFLLTDIEGSTRLWERRPDWMRSALAQHDEIVRKAVAPNEGTVFATAGDGFAAAFWSPADGASAALEVMARLGQEPCPADATIRARAALHVGVADERDGDYFGPVVTRTARLMAAAHGGQKAVADWLGHASPVVTLETYAHLMPVDEDRARTVIQAALAPAVSDLCHEADGG